VHSDSDSSISGVDTIVSPSSDDRDSHNGEHSDCEELSDTQSLSQATPITSDPRTLTKHETQESLDKWKSDIMTWLSLDLNFRTTKLQAFRGLSDDPPPGMSAQVKSLTLNAMLARISRLCPGISPRTLCNRTTSMEDIWQMIYLHFGCTS
jgi:hypothetical protein